MFSELQKMNFLVLFKFTSSVVKQQFQFITSYQLLLYCHHTVIAKLCISVLCSGREAAQDLCCCSVSRGILLVSHNLYTNIIYDDATLLSIQSFKWFAATSPLSDAINTNGYDVSRLE